MSSKLLSEGSEWSFELIARYEQEIARIAAQRKLAHAAATRRIADAETRQEAMVAESRGQVMAKVAKATAALDVQRQRVDQVRLQLEADRIKRAEAEREGRAGAANFQLRLGWCRRLRPWYETGKQGT